MTQAEQPSPRPLNLLALTDITQDTLAGTWTRQDGTLTSDSTQRCQIEFPYAPPPEYDLRILFVRSSGAGDMAVICHGGDHQFVWRMGGRPNSAAGFALIDSKGFARNQTSRQTQDWLTTGQPEELLIQVRKSNIAVMLNNAPVVSYATDYSNMTLAAVFKQRHPNTLGISIDHDDLTIQAADVLEISGTGKPLR